MDQNEATSSQAVAPVPLGVDPQALAPADKDSSNLDPTLQCADWVDFLNKIADYAAAQANSEYMWDRRRKTVKLRKHIMGEYYGIFDKSQGWVSGKTEGDGIYYDPQTATFIDDLVSVLTKSKPKKQCGSRNPERTDIAEAAKLAQKLLEFDDEQEFTPKRQQREWKLNLLAAGETYRLTYFNVNKPGACIYADTFQPMEIEGGESASYCPLCSGVVADEKGKCAQCGNPQMDEFKVQSTTITVQKGKAPKQIGDADYDIPDSLEMTVIGETDAIGEALITRRERMIPRCVLEDALGISNLPDTATPDSLHYKKIFEDKEDTSGMKEFKKLHYEELWISPAVYTSYRFPSPVQTNSGQTIPAQTRAKELFPHGFYFTRVKKRICQLFPQSAGDCLSHAVNSIGEGFHGQGEWDLNELQDQATELTSLKMNSAMLDSTSPLMVREGVVDTEAFENKVGQVVPVGQDASERSLDDIMRRVPMTGLSKEVYALSEETSGKMQHRVGAWSTQSDAPDVQAQGTATGIATIARQSLGRRGPQLQNYAQMEIDQAYQKLEQRQKYWPKKMYEQFALEIGSDAVKWFMNCNVRQDISITVAPGSWMPALDEDKKADFQAFLTLIGPLLLAKGDPKIIDDVIREGNNIFGNGSLNFADISQENVEARLRLDALQDVGSFTEQQFGQFILDPTTGDVNSEALNVAYAQTAKLLKIDHIQEDPQDIFATLPLDVMLDDHQEFIEAYKDWLKSAEGRAASIFVRTLVRELANYHIQAESFEAYKMKQYGNLAQLPDLQAGVIADQVQTEQDQMNQPPPAQPAPAPQPSPAQQIAQGINFKDLPPEAQHQLAQSAGINVGAPAFKAHAERQNPQPNAHP